MDNHCQVTASSYGLIIVKYRVAVGVCQCVVKSWVIYSKPMHFVRGTKLQKVVQWLCDLLRETFFVLNLEDDRFTCQGKSLGGSCDSYNSSTSVKINENEIHGRFES